MHPALSVIEVPSPDFERHVLTFREWTKREVSIHEYKAIRWQFEISDIVLRGHILNFGPERDELVCRRQTKQR